MEKNVENRINQRRDRISSERDSSLELFRIIVMLLIIAHHYVVNSGLNDLIYAAPLKPDSLFLFLFGAWGKTGINCFVMITGYFMCKSHITIKKFIKLVCEVLFYSIVIYIIFLISGYIQFEPKELLKAVIPVYSVEHNFTSCFFLFYLFIPFLNILIGHLNEKQHIRLILLSGFMYVVVGTIPKFRVLMNYVSWFTVLYFISSYIRLYNKPVFNKKGFWCVCTILLFVFSVCSIIVCLYIGERTDKKMAYYFLADSNKILAVLLGISSFMLFKNIKIKQSVLINAVSACTFGVLIIHANSNTMRQWLWKDLLDNTGMYLSGNSVWHALLCVPVIFIVCNIIDQIRLRVIEKPLLRIYDKLSPAFMSWWKRFDDKLSKKLKISE